MTNIQTITETQNILEAQIKRLQNILWENKEIRHDEIAKNADFVDTDEYRVLLEAAINLKSQINAYTDALYTLGDLKSTLS
jgi:hypothetical protein